MSDSNYVELLRKLIEKTSEKKAIWDKGNRADEFKIYFKTGSIVIDEINDKGDDGYTFEVYNENADKIYDSGWITYPEDTLFQVLSELLDTVKRQYYKVDETIESFEKELESDEIIGHKKEDKDDEIPF